MASCTVGSVCRLVVATRAAAVSSLSRSGAASVAPRSCLKQPASFARRGVSSSIMRSSAAAAFEGGSATAEGAPGGGGDGADKYDYEGEDPIQVLQDVTKKLMDCRRRKVGSSLAGVRMNTWLS
jgi:hypothetical protein